MSYSYDDFLKDAEASNLLGQFSDFDLDTAKEHPEFGKGILNYKRQYNSAQSAYSRAAANAGAEALRKRYGYTGGKSGSEYNPVSESEASLLRLRDELTKPESFSYDPESDPVLSAYKKQYIREGKRAAADALGLSAANTGGRASSYAVTAASQAQDAYAAKLADKVPELEDRAYDRYLKEQQQKRYAYNLLTQEEQREYERGRDALADARYEDETAYSRERDALADTRYEDETAYKRERDALADTRYEDETAYGRERDALADKRYDEQQAYQKERDAASDARYYAELSYKKDRDAANDAYRRERDEIADGRYQTEADRAAAQLEAERELALLKLINDPELARNYLSGSGASLPEETVGERVPVSYGTPGTTAGSASSKAKPSTNAEDLNWLREQARKLKESGVPNEEIRLRFWIIWQGGGITDDEWREFERVYA